MDVWIYFRRKEVEFRRFGLVPEYERYAANDNSKGTKGLLEAILPLTATAYLRILERVEIGDGGGVRRTRYSYVLVADGAHLHSWERDPTHDDMAVHEHVGPSRTRRRSQSVSFGEALARSWVLLSLTARPWRASEP